MQAIFNTSSNTLTIKPAAPVDAATFARLKNAGFGWQADAAAFVAAPANELARGVAADIAGHIETRDAPAKKRAAWAEYNGARLGGFPRAELLINDHAAEKSQYAALIYTRGETCNTAAFKPAGWQETEDPAENIAAIVPSASAPAVDDAPALQASGEAETMPASGEDGASEDDDASSAAELCADIERATYSPEDNKIRLYPVRRLAPEVYAQVKASGFAWAPRQGFFVAPMWTPDRADLAESLAGEIEDEDSTLAARAEDRADRFEDYSDKRASDADRARAAVSAIAENIPFGQPILIGHHSERHARKDAQRIEDGMRRAVKLWDTSEYWTRRAAGAIAHAKYKELPSVRARRIKTIEAEQRKQQRTLDRAEKFRAAWHADGLKPGAALQIANYDHVSRCFSLADYPRTPPASQYEGSMGLWSALEGGIITAEQARDIAIISHARTISHARRWIEHQANRIAYERAMLAESGGLESDRVKPEKGGAIRCLWAPRGGWAWIVKVNKVTVSILHNYGNGGCNFQHNEPLDKIREVMSAADVEAARAAGRLFETEDKTGFILAAPKPEDSAPAEPVQASGEDAQPTPSGEEIDVQASGEESTTPDGWNPEFSHWRHGGWYVHNVRYPSGAIGCVSNNYPDKKWRIACDDRRGNLGEPGDFTYKTRDAAARAERELAAAPAPQNIAAIAEPTPTPAADPGAAFAAMRESLRAGVQVVTAPQLFPTPAGLAARMVELADIQPGARVLEPSAGTGRILDAIDARQLLALVAVECNHQLAARLAAGYQAADVLAMDFLEYEPGENFDRVLMNPPFINGADIAHIKHAAGLLKPGGRLVALCANGPRQRAALQPLADYWEDLPAGTFAESGTGVRAALLVIEAPAATFSPMIQTLLDELDASGEAIEPTPSGEDEARRDPHAYATRPENYARILATPGEREAWQDVLDSFFSGRLVDIRNALRGLGWAPGRAGGVMASHAWPMVKQSGGQVFTIDIDLEHAGAGRNVVAVFWRVKDAAGVLLHGQADLLKATPEDLAAAFDAAAQPTPPDDDQRAEDDDAPAESAALTLTPERAHALSAADYRALVDGLEASNAHSHCALLDAKRYGTALDMREAAAILAEHERAGYLTAELSARRCALGRRLQQARLDDAAPVLQASGEAAPATHSGEVAAPFVAAWFYTGLVAALKAAGWEHEPEQQRIGRGRFFVWDRNSMLGRTWDGGAEWRVHLNAYGAGGRGDGWVGAAELDAQGKPPQAMAAEIVQAAASLAAQWAMSAGPTQASGEEKTV